VFCWWRKRKIAFVRFKHCQEERNCQDERKFFLSASMQWLNIAILHVNPDDSYGYSSQAIKNNSVIA
jgi:hypothetical protein